MTKKTIFIFFPLIIIQLIILVVLSLWIYQKQHSVVFDTRGISTISHTQGDAQEFIKPLQNDKSIASASSKAKSFFELGKKETYRSTPNHVTITYTTNNDFLNNTKNYSIVKPQNTYRIIMLGDSITFGLFVQTSQNYSELLEKMLNTSCTLKHYEVLNLGVPGYDLQYSAERLQVRGLKYHPDKVIWQINAGDFQEVNEYIVPNITNAGSIASQAAAKKEYAKQWPTEKLLAYQYAVLSDFSKSYKGPVAYMSLFPFDSKISALLNDTVLKDHPNNFWIVTPSIVSNKGVFPDGHPNVIGHQLIAKYLFNKLLSSPNFPCK